MCQLLGMNCASPTDFSFSLRGFCKRGGETDIHSHGWGVSVYEGLPGAIGLRSFHDTLPACQSPIAKFIQQYPMRTHNMMAHIRYATQGEVRLENVHPFVRVWKGIQICFAHNGECPQFGGSTNRIVLLGKAKEINTPTNIPYHPVGDTDSEAVFCALLNAMSAEFPDGLPSLPVLFEYLQSICKEIVDNHLKFAEDAAAAKNESLDQQMPVILNFLLGCGPFTLFAYSQPGKRPGSKVWNGLHYIVRQPPFSRASLLDDDYEIDFEQVTTATDRVAVIATKPLTTEESWTEFKPGQLILFDHGVPYTTAESCKKVECCGRGLCSRTVPIRYTELKNTTSISDSEAESRDEAGDSKRSLPIPQQVQSTVASEAQVPRIKPDSIIKLSPSSSTADLAEIQIASASIEPLEL